MWFYFFPRESQLIPEFFSLCFGNVFIIMCVMIFSSVYKCQLGFLNKFHSKFVIIVFKTSNHIKPDIFVFCTLLQHI